MTERYVAPQRDIELQGHYAGSVSRLLAWVLDAFAVSIIFAVLLNLARLAVEVVTGDAWDTDGWGPLIAVGFGLWSLVYFAFPWSMSGKTVGMAILGIQVTRTDGSYVSGGRAIVRTITLPLSFLLAGIGLLMGLFQRENRCLHDFFAGTVVVYSWDARRARLRLISRESS